MQSVSYSYKLQFHHLLLLFERSQGCPVINLRLGSRPSVITIIKFYISADFSIWDGSTLFISRERPIFCVPLEPFGVRMHSLDLLALMTIGFEKNEGMVCWKDNGIRRKAVCATTVLDQCVFPVFSIWQSTSIVVIVVCIFVIPANKTFIEAWKTRIFSSPSFRELISGISSPSRLCVPQRSNSIFRYINTRANQKWK